MPLVDELARRYDVCERNVWSRWTVEAGVEPPRHGVGGVDLAGRCELADGRRPRRKCQARLDELAEMRAAASIRHSVEDGPGRPGGLPATVDALRAREVLVSLRGRGYSNMAISEALGVSRRTIGRLLNSGAPSASVRVTRSIEQLGQHLIEQHDANAL